MKRQIVDLIIERIKSELESEKDLVSLTPVGSFADKSKELEKFNDLDFVIILKKVTKNNLSKIRKAGKTLRTEFESNEIGITSTSGIGPIKLKSRKPVTIMIHFLIYPLDKYSEYESVLTRYSFQSYCPLVGKSLKEISCIQEIKKDDLFNEIDGIPAMKKWITNAAIDCLEPNEGQYNVINTILKNESYAEVMIYSVLRIASNMLRLKGKFLGIDRDMCNEFIKNYSFSLNNLPLKILEMKERIRQGDKNISPDLKNESMNFLEECENLLK